MKSRTEQLQKSSDDIAKQMEKLTNDFRIGFGTFSEKPIIPFSQGSQSNQKPYSFHHQMSLKNDTIMFRDTLKNKLQDMQENVDNPEAGTCQIKLSKC